MARPYVLILGGGFIGKNLAQVAAESGLQPLVITRSEPWTGPPAEVVFGDATSREDLEPLIARSSHVMLAHSGLKPAESQDSPLVDLQALLEPIAALFSCLREHPGVGVTHFSSGGTVYGDAETIPTPETAPLSPTSFYGTNRRVAEQYLGRYASASNPVTILRCSNLYGRHQPAGGSQGLVAVVADRLQRGEPITVFGAGDTERDYVLATDCCEAALTLAFDGAEDQPLRLYNCGSGEGTETLDLVRRIAACLEIEPSIEFLPDREFDVRRSVLDISKLRAAIDFRPTGLDDGLVSTLAPSTALTSSGPQGR